MRIAISPGHALKIAGASGLIQEVPEARRVVPRVAHYLRSSGAQVIEIYDDTSTTVATNIRWLVNAHNQQNRDYDVSVHFNHSGGSGIEERAIGTEVLYLTQKELAARISKAMADAAGFINRGAKLRNDLGFLKTNKPAVLLEVCFVNSRADVRLYQAHFDAIARSISAALLGQPVPAQPPVQPPELVPLPSQVEVTVSAPKGVVIKVVEA